MTPFWPPKGSELSEAIAQFVSKLVFDKFDKFKDYTALGVFNNSDVVGGVLFHDYHEDEGIIQISAAATNSRWLTRRVLFEMFGFAFNKIGCQAVMLNVDPENKVMRSIAERYGFKTYEIPRLGGRNKSQIIFVLADDDWRKNGFHKDYN